jgi:mono/diheme cytochrome c family protein
MIPRLFLLALLPSIAGLCGEAGTAAPSGGAAAALGISFIPGSTSTLLIEKNGQTYLVDLAAQTVQGPQPSKAATPDGHTIFAHNCAPCHGPEGKGIAAMKTPDFTDPKVQASLTDDAIRQTIRNGKKGTAMPAWRGKLSEDEIASVAGYLRTLGSHAAAPQSGGTQVASEATNPAIYKPGDDWLLSLPTGRQVDQHGLYVNFTHRFAYDPAFSGSARGGALAGLDGFSLSSFGFRYGVTNDLSVSAYRSPTFLGRPIQLMAAYRLAGETDGKLFNAMVRFSVEGQNDFAKNYTENLELILSRSITGRAQFYAVPTFSANARHLFQPASYLSSAIPDLPGVNTFSIGFGGAFDIRPTVALVAEVIPTLVNGRPLGIHRPAYSFGIQKKIFRHAFTLGFLTNPGTTVSQRAATRAAYLNDPSADKPSELFIGFDLMRQLH